MSFIIGFILGEFAGMFMMALVSVAKDEEDISK